MYGTHYFVYLYCVYVHLLLPEKKNIKNRIKNSRHDNGITIDSSLRDFANIVRQSCVYYGFLHIRML